MKPHLAPLPHICRKPWGSISNGTCRLSLLWPRTTYSAAINPSGQRLGKLSLTTDLASGWSRVLPCQTWDREELPQTFWGLSRQLREYKQEQHCRGATDLGSKKRQILMNIRKRVIFRQVLYLPGNTTSPGYLHPAGRRLGGEMWIDPECSHQ